jgi:multiple antibiotic resistance protein
MMPGTRQPASYVVPFSPRYGWVPASGQASCQAPLSAARDLDVQTKASALGEAKSVYRQIVIPFAMPLLVGPGVIANLILYATEARRIHSPAVSLGMIGITIGVAGLAFVILLMGRVLRRFLGDIGLGILTRILGLLVAAIGMQFLVTGTSDVIVQTIAPEILKLH